MGRLAKLALLASLLCFAAGSSVARAGGWKGHHRGWRHGHHHHGGYSTRVFVGVGPLYGPYAYSPYSHSPYGWGPAGYWRPWIYGPAYPRVMVEEPPVYIERERATDASWYFCESAGEYYPYVRTCPEAWVKVPPRPE